MKTSASCVMTAVAVGTLAVAGRLAAQTPPPADAPPSAYITPPPPAPPLGDGNYSVLMPGYHAQELSVDIFGAAATAHDYYNHSFGDYQWLHPHGKCSGAGIKFFFFTKYVGVGADGLVEYFNPHVDTASGKYVDKDPAIGNTGLAPYVFAGGGQFDHDRNGFGQAGVGLEFRLARHFGVFVDGRRVIPGEHAITACFAAACA